jgi:hypothetical protein
MSASEHINENLFHGTSRKFKSGDLILPPSQSGATRNWGAKSKNDPNLAYATDNLQDAKYYGSVSKITNRRPDARTRVYEVEPVNPETAGWTETKFRDGSLRQHTSPDGYRVVRRVYTERNPPSK